MGALEGGQAMSDDLVLTVSSEAMGAALRCRRAIIEASGALVTEAPQPLVGGLA